MLSLIYRADVEGAAGVNGQKCWVGMEPAFFNLKLTEGTWNEDFGARGMFDKSTAAQY
jgi:hypothetical protein